MKESFIWFQFWTTERPVVNNLRSNIVDEAFSIETLPWREHYRRTDTSPGKLDP
jgi:hypothetical protein